MSQSLPPDPAQPAQAQVPPFVQVLLDVNNPAGPPIVQSNIEPIAALMLLARGMARSVQHMGQTMQIVPRAAIVLPDGSPAPSAPSAPPARGT